jgi:hypothetical protein
VPRVSWIPLAAEEPSKTAFYIAGGVLTCWAVIVAFVGITRPDFPPVRNAVIAVTVALVAAAMTTAVVTA